MTNIDLKRKSGKQRMFLDESGEVALLKFPHMEECSLVSHGFTTRLGGVSKEEFTSLNLSFTRGDDEAAVIENFSRTARSLNRKYEDFVGVSQIHSTRIIEIKEEDRGRGVSRDRGSIEADGMITNVPGVVLSTFFADCVPIFLLDPVKKAVGMVHSGWRGTAGKIGAEAVYRMKERYGTNPCDILAGIGPSICMECYEVSVDVKEEFEKTFSSGEIESIFQMNENKKYQLDLWKAIWITLKQAGLKEENIQVTDICTCCNHGYLFSHRASKGKRGNLGGFISLN